MLDDALISTKQALTMALTEGSGRALRPDHVLHGVSLKVSQGDTVTIIGANDAVGLRAINARDQPCTHEQTALPHARRNRHSASPRF